MNKELIIKADKLVLDYKSNLVLKNASFNITPRTFNVVLGPNGSGKTTLFKAILGLKEISSGTLLVFNEEPKRGNKKIAFIPQKRDLEGINLKVRDFVRLGLDGYKWGIGLRFKGIEQKIDQALSMVDAKVFKNKSINQLSGGEVQRIFLAQALVGNPEVLLLDEPMANLDIKWENELLMTLDDLVKKEGLTVILITHDLNPLYNVTDQVIYMANHKLASGKVEEILTSDILSNLYDSNVEVVRDAKNHQLIIGIEEKGHQHV